MQYEVEQKFPLADLGPLEDRLAGLGASISGPQAEIDRYFAHPAKDFARTDEALRVRRKGEMNYLTYKGPKVDATTKTRREIELPVAEGEQSAVAWGELLEALGFKAVADVCKSRRKAFLAWQGRRVEISLDEVDGLGSFVELELVVDAGELEPAKACIASLAGALGLAASERRSYLELLLTKSQIIDPKS